MGTGKFSSMVGIIPYTQCSVASTAAESNVDQNFVISLNTQKDSCLRYFDP